MPDHKIFEREWFDLASQICERIYAEPEVKQMEQEYRQHGSLSYDKRSDFIALANKVKAEVMAGKYGELGSSDYEKFKERWRHWYDHKGVVSSKHLGRKLSNEEHIVYSSTPDAEEFFNNMESDGK